MGSREALKLMNILLIAKNIYICESLSNHMKTINKVMNIVLLVDIYCNSLSV